MFNDDGTVTVYRLNAKFKSLPTFKHIQYEKHLFFREFAMYKTAALTFKIRKYFVDNTNVV